MADLKKVGADSKFEKVAEKFGQVKKLHDKLTEFYEFKEVLNKEEFEFMEVTLVGDRENTKSVRLMPDDKEKLKEIADDNIEILEQLFIAQTKNFMGDDK